MWSKVVKILSPKCRQSRNKRAVKTQLLSSWRRHYLQLTIFTPKTFSLLIVVQGTDLRSVSILTFLQNKKYFYFLGKPRELDFTWFTKTIIRSNNLVTGDGERGFPWSMLYML